MPYIDDANNEKKYIPSKYAKEELPTWNEIYNEFYKEMAWFYDPTDESHQTEDLYWKVPHRKILLGWVCNQFNKMLFEDDNKTRVLDWMNVNLKDNVPVEMKDVHFTLFEAKDSSDSWNNLYSYDTLPIIYTCEIPSTGKRSIFSSSLPSKNIKEIDSEIQLFMIIKDADDNTRYVVPDCGDGHMFWDVIKVLIKDVIVYFEGSFVGWKDANGEAITGPGAEVKPGCGYQAGFDAAI